MRLTNLSTLKPLDTLKPLERVKATTQKREIIPSQIDLLLLSSNLLYKAKLILDGEIQTPKGISPLNYTNEALKLISIVDNYEKKYLSTKETNEIKKRFKLKDLYS